jgi:heptosyltransferase I
LRTRLRSVRYDWVLDCQGLIKSAVVARLARASDRAGPDWRSAREPLASLAYRLKAAVPRELHVVTRNRMIGAAAFGYPLDEPPRFGLQVPAFEPPWLGASTAVPAGDVGATPPHAVLITGASRPQKLWPDHHWVEIGRGLRDRGYRLVWFWGSEAERARAMQLAAACGTVADLTQGADVRAGNDSATTVSIVPPFLAVADAAGLLASSRLVVGLDTGFTHLAGALGRPTIGIFCDFDATQCAVSGDGFCASLGGVGQVPSTREVGGAIDAAVAGAAPAQAAPFLDTSTHR